MLATVRRIDETVALESSVDFTTSPKPFSGL